MRPGVVLLIAALAAGCSPPAEETSDMRDLTPFLTFQEGRAEEAMRFYVSVVPGSSILEIQRWQEGETGAVEFAGRVKLARFSLGGLEVRASDSPIPHDWGFSPAVSLFLTCRDDDEIERLAEALVEGGQALMPLDNYGFSRRFTWIEDRFGVSWQLNLE